MRRLIWFLPVYLLIGGMATAQTISPQVVGSAGSSAKVGNKYVSSTLGVPYRGTGFTDDFIITAGFNQPVGDFDLKKLPVYEIGEIPDQFAWFNQATMFYVTCSKHSIGNYSVIAQPQPAGELTINSNSGKFCYIADAAQQKEFSVVFSSIKGSDSVKQTVLFKMMPSVACENSYFGMPKNTTAPDGSSDDFLVISREEVHGEMNFLPPGTLYRYTLSGRILEFNSSKENKLAAFIKTSPRNIEKLNIYAEKVIINDPLWLPQTQITIYARTLEFKGNSFICTTPDSSGNKPNSSGKNGLNAGNVNVYVENLTGNIKTRFILTGGKGEHVLSDNQPGNGGNGGNLTSNIDLTFYCNLDAGQPGISGNNTVFGSKGKIGFFSQNGSDYSWLHPCVAKTMLQYTDYLYQNDYRQDVQNLVNEYIRLITDYRATNAWTGLSDKNKLQLETSLNELVILSNRISNGIDYFGNPPGWVPMLSYEVNKTVYEGEIDYAFKAMYLYYFLNNLNKSKEEKLANMEKCKELKEDEVSALKTDFNNAIERKEELENDANEISASILNVQEHLSQLEQEIQAKTEAYQKMYNTPPPSKAKSDKYFNICIKVVSYVPMPDLPDLNLSLTGIADVALPGNLTDALGISDQINALNFPDLIGSFYENLLPLDLLNIDLKNPVDLQAISKLNSSANELFGAIKQYNLAIIDKLQEISSGHVKETELNTILAEIKADAAEFESLISELEGLMLKKRTLLQQINDILLFIASTANNIEKGVIALNCLRDDLFNGNLNLNHEAMQHVKQMEADAMLRLLKYRYYMIKAYEYRLLKSYSEDMDPSKLFRDILSEIETSANNGTPLTNEKFDDLKVLYEDIIHKINADIIKEFNEGGIEYSANVTYELDSAQLVALNTDQELFLNLYECGLFPQNQDNIRIEDIVIQKMEISDTNQGKGQFGYTDLKIEHSGVSTLSRNENRYYFNHYSSIRTNPFIWGMRYDLKNGLLNPVRPSVSSNSLLQSVLQSSGDYNEKLMLFYSRPSADAGLIISKSDNSSKPINLKKIQLKIVYDYSNFDDKSLSKISVKTNLGLKPYIELSKSDNNQRKNGWGSFERVYYKSDLTSLTISVPGVYGEYKFKGWTDKFGNPLTGKQWTEKDTVITLTLNDNFEIVAGYAKNYAVLHIEPKVFHVNKNQGSKQFRVANLGNGKMDWEINPSDTWIIAGTSKGSDNGQISFSYAENNTGEVRTGFIEIVAPKAVNFRDTIYIFQSNSMTSVDEHNLEQIQIYPNPVNNLLFIRFSKPVFNPVLVTIYNLSGSKIYTTQLLNSATIDFCDMVKGCYIVEVISDETINKIRILKQ